jgi:hypothetical protein
MSSTKNLTPGVQLPATAAPFALEGVLARGAHSGRFQSLAGQLQRLVGRSRYAEKGSGA